MSEVAFGWALIAMSLTFWVLTGYAEEAEEVWDGSITGWVYWCCWTLWNTIFNFRLMFINMTAVIYIILAALEPK